MSGSRTMLDTRNLEHFTRTLQPEAERAVTETTTAVWARARVTVAVDTGELQSGMEMGGSGLEQSVENDVEHGPAQEFGRPDLANYTYTPFMKPSAEAERARHTERVKQALRRAANRGG